MSAMPAVSLAYTAMGQVQADAGRPEQALATMEFGLALRRRIPGLSPWPLVHHLLAMSRTAVLLADLPLARTLLAEAVRAMAGFDDPAVLGKALDLALTDEIRIAEIRYLFGPAFTRRRTQPVAEAWVRAHWDELRKKLPGSLSAGLVGAAGVGCSKAEAEERAAFYTPRAAAIEGTQRGLAEALESVSLCAELRRHGASALTKALSGDAKKK